MGIWYTFKFYRNHNDLLLNKEHNIKNIGLNSTEKNSENNKN